MPFLYWKESELVYKVVVMVRNKIITFNLEIQFTMRLLHLFLLSLQTTKTSVRFKVFLGVILVIFFLK